jgi:hypothetical protein
MTMGNTTTQGLAEAVAEGIASRRQALTAHVTTGFFPPLPREYVAVAEAVLDALEDAGVVEDDDLGWDVIDPSVWQRDIDLPALNPMPREARVYDDGTGTATVAALFRALRLEYLVGV